MPNAITTNERLAYLAEAAWGVTPAAALKLTRFTSVGSKQDKTTTESAEVRTDRSIADIIQTARSGGVSWNFELSSGLLDDLLVGLLGNAWAADVLKLGNTRTSYTLERQLTDIGQFLTYKGAVPVKLDLSIALGQIIGGSWDFASKSPVVAGVTAGTGAAVAAPTNAVMDPIASIQLIQEGGAGAVAGVTECSMSLANSLINFEQLASVDPLDIQLGDLVASGKIGLYMADATYLTKYLNHTTTSLKVKVGGVAAASLEFFFPKIKLTTFDAPNQGKNNKVIQMFDWKAMTDAVDTQVRITRVT